MVVRHVVQLAASTRGFLRCHLQTDCSAVPHAAPQANASHATLCKLVTQMKGTASQHHPVSEALSKFSVCSG